MFHGPILLGLSCFILSTTAIRLTEGQDNRPLAIWAEDEDDEQRPPRPSPPPPPPLIPALMNKTLVHFYLYARKNPQKPQLLKIGDYVGLKAAGFNDSIPSKLLIHGFASGVNKTMIRTLKEAYLSKGSVNVLVVDWSRLAAVPWYHAARASVPRVGRLVARLIDFVARASRRRPFRLHVVGHSLGAHVAGVAGKHVRSGRLNRITGLDPAKPLFASAAESERLSIKDAAFVDVIHTTAGWYGLKNQVGHVDFYPNGGTWRQPGCKSDIYGRCSHAKAYRLFAASIAFGIDGVDNELDSDYDYGTNANLTNDDFLAFRCGTVNDALVGRCSGELAFMGEKSPGANAVDLAGSARDRCCLRDQLHCCQHKFPREKVTRNQQLFSTVCNQ